MPPIRPIQFSALKTLDPLDQQPQRGEDDNDQADIEHVGHGPSSDCRNPGATAGISGDHAVLTGKWGASAGPCGTHARGTRIPNRTHAGQRVRRVAPAQSVAGDWGPRRTPTSWARASRSAGSL